MKIKQDEPRQLAGLEIGVDGDICLCSRLAANRGDVQATKRALNWH